MVTEFKDINLFIKVWEVVEPKPMKIINQATYMTEESFDQDQTPEEEGERDEADQSAENQQGSQDDQSEADQESQ